MAQAARNTSAHPGILVIKPTPRRPYYAVRYADPVTGTTRQPRLFDIDSDESAEAAAVELAGRLQQLRPRPLAQPAPAPVRVRTESATRGVIIINPTRQRPYYALRHKDPATGLWRQTKLEGVTTRAGAEEAAEKLSTWLMERRKDVALVGGREFAGSTNTLAEEAKLYLKTVGLKVSRHGKRTSPTTVRRYRASLEAFGKWCEERGVTRLRQLARSTLAEWLLHRQTSPAYGHAREVSTVNQEIKPLRQMLVAAALAGRLHHLSSDAVRASLPRLTQPAPKPRCYSVLEVRAALRAALELDAADPSAAAVAPAVAVALLSGMRRGELAALQCHEIVFDAPSEYDPEITTGVDVIRLPSKKTKTGIARDVLMAPYSPLLGELMRALKARRPGHERVLRIGYVALGDLAKRLRDFGAPADFSWKDCRSTCATYQLPLPGNPKAKAARLGHTLAIAELHYLALPTGTPLSAPDLETVMKCAPELSQIIARVAGERVA